MKRSIFLCAVVATFLSLSTTVSGSETNFVLYFSPADFSFEKVDGFDQVKMESGISSAEPGYPSLPTRFVQIAIPRDVEVEGVEVISSKRQELSGTYSIYPAQC